MHLREADSFRVRFIAEFFLGLGILTRAITAGQESLPFPTAPSASVPGPIIQESVHARRSEPSRLPKDAPNILVILIDDVGPATPDRPFFVDRGTGAAHGPHHVPSQWAGKYKGKFDEGCDKYRERVFARQKERAQNPEPDELTPCPESISAWDDQPKEVKSVVKRLTENCAAFMADNDHHIRRLINIFQASGELDSTFISYIVGDKGAATESSLEGTFSELASYFGGTRDILAAREIQ